MTLQQLIDVRTAVGLVIGAVVGIAGTTFTIWLQAHVEHRHWLRQQRLEACASFLAGVDAIVRPATRWHLAWSKREEAAERETFFDQLERLERDSGRIHLLSGSDVNRATVRLLRQWSLELNSALKSHDEDGYLRGFNASAELYREFVKAARSELGEKAPFLSQTDMALLDAESPDALQIGAAEPKR